VASLVD